MILYLFLTALTLLLTKWYFERKKKFQILADYGYNVPPINFIAGNLHQIAKDDIGTMEDWMERYGEEIGEKGGKIMGWYRGPNPALWTSSPELLKVSYNLFLCKIIGCEEILPSYNFSNKIVGYMSMLK